jgi:hypothetical protein
MRIQLLLLFFVASCFRFEVDGGVLACPDNVCPNDLICEDGIRGDDLNAGFCAAPEKGPCVANLGCSPTPECPGLDDCVSGVVCVDPKTLEDVPSFQNGAGGVCAKQVDLNNNDDCLPLNVLQRCPTGLGCSEEGQCELRTGELGDTCDNAIILNEPQTILLDLAGLFDDSNSDPLGICSVNGVGAGGSSDLFLRYTVQSNLADVTVSTTNNGTLSDTVVYIGTACDAVNPAIITGEFACDDDTDGDFSQFGSFLFLANQAAGTELFIVVDSFDNGREGLVELTISED